MFEKQSEYIQKVAYEPAIAAGTRCGRLAVILLIVDFVFSIATGWIYALLENLDVSFELKHGFVSVLNLGEIVAAIVFIALLTLFVASGALAVRRTGGLNDAVHAICVSGVSGLITGSMAAVILVAGMVALTLDSMPENGYITMFTQFSPDTIFGILMWLPAIVLIAITSGICYAGMTARLKKLY